MTHEVFISYSHHDKLIADGVCANLEQAGIRCWIAPRDIAPGHDWPTSISEAIKKSHVFVLIFSSRSNSSKDVGRELILAANRSCIIVPFKIEDVAPEPGKEYYLARTHWLDAMDPPTQEQVNKLVSCVHALLVEAGVEFPVKPAEKQPPVTEVNLPAHDLLENIQPVLTVSQESRSVKKEALPAPPQVSTPIRTSPGKDAKLPVKKPRISRVIILVMGFAGIILLLGVILIWQDILHIPALSSIISPPTSTPTFTGTPSPRLMPTRTPTPSPTNTPLPAWVSTFAQPILAAIADQPPTFQDDFGPSSAGWTTDDWCGSRMRYDGGELVSTGCGLHHDGIDFSDFVVEIDGRFLAHSAEDVDWGISFRNSSCPPCTFAVHYNCSASIKMYKDTVTLEDYQVFDKAAFCSIQTNHLMMIAKGSSMAFYVNDQPLFFVGNTISRWGGISVTVWNDGGTTSDTLPSVAFDNFKIWDIGDLP